jgi:Carboxypeptidase regulatory-like domain
MLASRSLCRFLVTVSVLCTGLLLFSATPAWGQAASSGTVVGVLTDPSGAVIPGATVTLTDISTRETRTTLSNDTGRYVFTNVTPGRYDIVASKKGFAVARIPGQKVNVGAQTNANLQLPLGAATQTVEVQASGTELQTMNATVGNTVSGIALQSLPSLGRDVSTFAVLQPGVSPDGSVAGAVLDQNSFMLDGGNNTNDMDGSMNQYTPSFSGDPSGGITFQTGNSNPNFGGFTAGQGQSGVPTGVMPTPADSIEEFKVNTNNQTADFNSSAGAEVRMVTKRGTDAWHGSVYEYYLNNNFNANTWDNNHTGVRQPNYHYNRFGAAIGGPIIPKEILGGKTYFFANYQGFRWPNSETIEKTVPSANMRAGILTFAGTNYNVAAFDPLGIGVNPLISQLWGFVPLPNDPGCGLSRCDGVNVLGFKANLSVPQNDDFGVARLDHDFGPNWHWTASYRYYHLTRATHDQVDIGGFFPGDVKGVPKSLTNRPQVPWYLVTGLTTNISSNTSNDFHFSYLRNYWAWQSREDPPQFPGLGGALELFGESRDNVLIPYNVNTQQTRTRFWNGHDWMFRDDVSSLHGNHLLQFGGTYQRNWDWHQRTDNGGGINYQPVYQLGTTTGAGIDLTGFLPATLPESAVRNWGRDYAAMLGIVSVTQQAFTRTGANLVLNPPNTPAFDKSTIRSYNVYFSDTWHMRPTFTLTYGLGWTLQMPPIEEDGKVIVPVNENNNPLETAAYLGSRRQAALQGQVFNPPVGFALVGNVAGNRKYPYDPFYRAFSPRLAAAWNVTKDTVIRAGYSRIYGRLNGVDLVLLPLLGTGLIQPVQCIGALASGGCSTSATPATAFRIGVNGLVAPLPAASGTLPQPLFPGVNDIATSAPAVLDPKFRPSSNDQFDLTIQRQLGRKTIVEVGYIGRLMRHELQPININAVPHMMTLGGQSFANAYAAIQVATQFGANMSAAVPPQPFFEAAMKPAFCAGFSSCTAAVVAAEATNIASQSVWNMWSDLDNGGFSFPRSMLNTPILGSTFGESGQATSGIAIDTSLGHSNYHAGFFTVRMSDWHGLTMQHNFTWSKSLGTGAVPQATSAWTAVDAFDLNRGYGYQAWDRRLVYTTFLVWQPSIYKGQQGLLGRVLGGWTFAPIFSAGSGLPLQINTLNGDSQAFGEGDSLNFFSFENGVLTGAFNQGNSRHSNVPGANGIGDGGFGVNLFGDPVAAFGLFRNPVLGLDQGHNGGAGILRGLPFWNMDVSVRKNFKLTERFSTEAQVVFTNVLNHNQFADPILDLSNPSQWGVLTTQGNTPRQMEFGIRFNF